MNYLQKLIEASTQVADNYLNLETAELIRRINGLSEEEYEEAFKKLQDSIEYEDFCMEEVYLKMTNDDYLKLFSGEMGITDLTDKVFERVVAKIEKRNLEPVIAEQNAKDSVEKIFGFMESALNFSDDSLKGREEEAKREAEQAFIECNRKNAMNKEVELEFFKKFLFFLDKAMENADDNVYSELMHIKMNFIYSMPLIEVQLLKSRFYQNPDTIGVQNLIGKDENETTEYLIFLQEMLDSNKSLLLNVINGEINILEDNLSTIEYVKCAFRATLYLLDVNHFNHSIKQLEKMMADLDGFGKSILEDIIQIAKQDRLDYPKVEFAKEELEIVAIENQISELYEKLADLEIRRYNGEDTDFEFQRVLDAIKLARVEEERVFMAECKKCLNESDTNTLLSLHYEIIDDNQLKRLTSHLYSIPSKIDPNFTPSNETQNSIYMLGAKSMVFFLDDYSKNVIDEKLRNRLIRYKYSYIHKHPLVEDTIIYNGGQIPRELISLEGVMATESEKEEYNRLKEDICIYNIIETLNSIIDLSTQNSINDSNEFSIIRFIIVVRSLLYMLDEEGYNKAISSLDDLVGSLLITGEYAAVSIINGIIKDSIKDREKYPKLVL